jgi:predicted alpha/beta superfamily hydrolase
MKNVWIPDEAFYMPQLDRYRRIWLYLPEGYERSRQEYPVLYMHDGQNLFDDSISFSGSWKVHETLNEQSSLLWALITAAIKGSVNIVCRIQRNMVRVRDAIT